MKLMWIKGKITNKCVSNEMELLKLDLKNGWNKIQICTQWWNQI